MKSKDAVEDLTDELVGEVTQEQINVFVLNSVADRMLYTTGMDFDPRAVLDMMSEMGVRIEGFEIDTEKFSGMLEDTIRLGFEARDKALALAEGEEGN